MKDSRPSRERDLVKRLARLLADAVVADLRQYPEALPAPRSVGDNYVA